MIESFKLPNITPETLTGSICSFTDEYGGLPLKSCTSLITGYQEGSGTPSPSNVRPLHAFSSADLYFNTINQWDEQWESGTYNWNTGEKLVNSTYIRNKNKIRITAGKTYYFLSPKPYNIFFYNENGEFIEPLYKAVSGEFSHATASYINFSISNTSVYNNDISINYPATDTSYHAFSGAVFTFGQSIYQGSIDRKRGVVVGTWGIADLGSLTWLYNTQYINPIFMANIPEAKVAIDSGFVPNAICSQYQVLAPNRTNVEGVNHVITVDYYYSSYNNIYIIDKDYTDPTAFKTAMNGVMLAYELATPIEIPLGGINLLTQQGVNNIFADCGDTEVTHLKVT